MKWWTGVLAISYFVAVAVTGAGGCTCAFGSGPACEEAWRKSTDAVFLGRVEKIESSRSVLGGAPGAMSMTMIGGTLRVSIAVEESYRGPSAKTTSIFTASSSAACGYSFQKGERYLIYASAAKDGALVVSLCSATKPAKYAEKDVAYFHSMPSQPPTATIMGSVWRYTHDPNFKPKSQPSLMDHYLPPEQDYVAMVPMPGFLVVAKAEDGTSHDAVVDSDGTWQISSLSPGLYTLHPRPDEATFVYPFEARVELSPRGCAKVDIRVESNGRISGTLEHHAPESDWALLTVFVLSYPNPDWHHPVRETTLETDASTFEIGPLPAGQYVLGAYVVRKIGTPDRYSFADWGWTYFPGVYDPKLAQPIEVVEGKSVSNVKLKMMY